MRVTVAHSDGTTKGLAIKPVTIVAFERQFGVGLGAAMQGGRMEYVYWLAWDAEKRGGAIVKPFDGWVEDIEDVDIEDDAVPTEAPTVEVTPGS
jgi:hypothetical protein